MDATLQVGGIAESVTVTGETPLIETATASIASAIDKAQMEVLPTPGRNVFIMAVTAPGVVHGGDPVFVRMQDQTNASLISLGGGPLRGNNYTLDGVAISDLRGRSVINPSFESPRGDEGTAPDLRLRDGENEWRRVQLHPQERLPTPGTAAPLYQIHPQDDWCLRTGQDLLPGQGRSGRVHAPVQPMGWLFRGSHHFRQDVLLGRPRGLHEH